MHSYFPNNYKSWLVVKPQAIEKAKQLFANTGINITTAGRWYLGAKMEKMAFVNLILCDKLERGIQEFKQLSHTDET
jgi:hypothetical protein